MENESGGKAICRREKREQEGMQQGEGTNSGRKTGVRAAMTRVGSGKDLRKGLFNVPHVLLGGREKCR